MYNQVSWTDSSGRSWLLEDDGTEGCLIRQQALREAFPVQNVVKRPQMVEKWYTTLANATTVDEVLKQICRCISWGNTYDFRNLTVRDTLNEKLALPMNENQTKAITLAIKALEQKGAIPKKLKAVIGIISGDTSDEDE